MKDVVFDDDMAKHFKALADLEECANMKLTHFGIPVSWSLTSRVPCWSKNAPLPGSFALGEIIAGEA
jgi:hypothetical protein